MREVADLLFAFGDGCHRGSGGLARAVSGDESDGVNAVAGACRIERAERAVSDRRVA